MKSTDARTTYLAPSVVAPNVWVAAGLLIVGAALVAYAGGTGWNEETNWWRYKVAIVFSLLGILPPVNRSVAWALSRRRRPSARGASVIALSLALLATIYFIFAGLRQGREFIPKFHDEHVYLLQAQMAAHARLWMRGLPLPDFFETFYVFVRPVYAPVYFPGTALFYAPTVWFNISPFIWSASVCGAIVGLTFRVMVELIDGVAALLGALLMLALPTVHLLSLMVMSHPVSLLLGLGMVWSWLRWMRGKRLQWIMAIGFFAGWAAITRPFDALCYAIPIAAAVLWNLRGLGRSAGLKTTGVGLLAAAPFLGLQFAFDRVVTGHALRTPVAQWDHLYAPQWEIGVKHDDSNFRPPTQLPEMQQFYDQFVLPGAQDVGVRSLIGDLKRRRIPDLLRTVVPAPLLLLLLPLGFVGLRGWPRWVVFMGLPLSVILYACYPLHLSYYALIAAPAALMLVVMGTGALASAFGRRHEQAQAVIAMAVAAVAFTSLSELNPWLTDPNVAAPVLSDTQRKLSEITRPAVVLFHFEPGNDANEEPVYNITTPWPDDARVIRAHDLGNRNIELFRYFANQSPRRMIYLYDENTLELRELGMADALARRGG